MALKVYSGTNLSKSYLGSNITTNQGAFYPIVDPSTISSLQYWLDPVDVGGNVNSVPNGGAKGGGWSINKLAGATDISFISGSGDTKEFIFGNNGNVVYPTVYSVGRNMKTDGFEATGSINTVISIARLGVQGGFVRVWGMDSSLDPASGGDIGGGELPAHIFDPAQSLALQIGFKGRSGGIQIEPDIDLGSYSYGDTNLKFFATTVDGCWYNDYNTVRMQSNLNNNTSTTPEKTLFPTPQLYYKSFAVGANPGGTRSTTGVAAVMVFDEILDEETIGGIYRYYKETRGYSID